jgi:hypothetical protein
VLEIVAEQTGYPLDMLEWELDMEADLGIDTVKQAETFAAIRAAFGIPRRDDVKLRDYPTLGHVVGFVREARPDLVIGAPVAQVISEPVAPVSSAEVVSDPNFPRRVPVAVVRPPLAWSKPTGVALAAGELVLLMPDKGGVGKALQKRLEKRGVTVVTLNPDADLVAQVQGAGQVRGVYWLPALDGHDEVAGLGLAEWRGLTQAWVKDLFVLLHTLAQGEPEVMPFLVSGTRLGGFHGYNTAVSTTNPLGGAVTGFTKAYKREATNALVKAIDFPASRKTASIADLLIEETMSDPGVVEVGYDDAETRYGISFAVENLPEAGAGMTLNKETVFLITGAAGGITSAITADLAQASGGIFYLLDLTPEPNPTDPHIAQFRQEQRGFAKLADCGSAGAGRKAETSGNPTGDGAGGAAGSGSASD